MFQPRLPQVPEQKLISPYPNHSFSLVRYAEDVEDHRDVDALLHAAVAPHAVAALNTPSRMLAIVDPDVRVFFISFFF